jgi:Pectate lyase superfamily protein
VTRRFVCTMATLAAALVASTSALAQASAFLAAPNDARATTVRGVGDGRADDTAEIQRAIDEAADQGGGGIVFLPEGTYRITRTVYIWPGVRLFGVGNVRPKVVLGDRTPGYQRGLANMIIFAGARRVQPGQPRVPFPPPGSVPFDPSIADANPGTFYSAMSNIDIAIGAGNPAAAAIRFHAAQHAFVSHMRFDLGSGLAGLYQVGNIGQDLYFRGGRYGILTEKPSPAWPFALIDATFEGQRDAAIREHEAGLTMVNVAIRDMATGCGARTSASRISARLRSSSRTRTTSTRRSGSRMRSPPGRRSSPVSGIAAAPYGAPAHPTRSARSTTALPCQRSARWARTRR